MKHLFDKFLTITGFKFLERHRKWHSLFMLAVFSLIFAFVLFENTTQIEFSSHCKVDNYEERTYNSLVECNESVKSDISQFGYVCGCRRSDGIYDSITKILARFV